ncbi:hypothetical protein PINS_up016874 [Pythium insidiosum]|nr:hypothetical protein PINS_up016874 [Pythium insidiosum]
MARKPQRSATPEERLRVLDAIDRDDPDWIKFAASNGVSRSSAYALRKSRRLENEKRGGVRAGCVKVTPAMMTTLEEEFENNPGVTLERMKDNLYEEYGVDVHISTISRHMIGMTYTVKQMRVEKDAMNNLQNNAARLRSSWRLIVPLVT